MVWSETPRQATTSASTVDVFFKLKARLLPAEHRLSLFDALSAHLPWLAEAGAGVAPIQDRSSGNGWQRGNEDSTALVPISRRARLHLRVPRARADDAATTLDGKTLDIDGHAVVLGTANVRELVPEPTLYARGIIAPEDDEPAFQARVVSAIEAHDIVVNRVLCGLCLSTPTSVGPLTTRAFLIADLTPAESLRLQSVGVGDYRHLGCGLFVPHKSVAAVAE